MNNEDGSTGELPILDAPSVQKVIADFELRDGERFHVELQKVSDIYHATKNRSQPPSIESREEDTDKVVNAVSKTLNYLADGDNIASQSFLRHLDARLQKMLLDKIAEHPDLDGAPRINSHDILAVCSEALSGVRSESKAWLDWRRESKASAKSLPGFPELKLAFSNLEKQWVSHRSPEKKPQKFSYYVSSKTHEPNKASQFAVTCLQIIDPTLYENNILSQFKKWSVETSKRRKKQKSE